MKFLLLCFTLFSSLALATDTSATWGVTHYHGAAVFTTADGTQTQALVALKTTEMASTDFQGGMLFVYQVHMHGKDSVHAFYIRRQPNTGFYKVYVPVDASVTNTVETALLADMQKFRESGWGHSFKYRGKHGYTKNTYHLNYLYTSGDRIDHSITFKHYDDGSRKVYSHVTGGNDADGLQYVWRDKMTMMPTLRD